MFSGQNLNIWNINKHEKILTPKLSLQAAVSYIHVFIIYAFRRKKKYLWFRFQTDPIFFCRPYYFFNAIDRATLFSPGGCGLLPKWRLLSH
jgi:hypothetical protein